VEKFQRLGVESVDLHRVLATAIENYIFRPATYHDLVETFENFNVEEINVTNPKLEGKFLREIAFHNDAILMMIKREKTSFVPHGETYLKLGDILHVFGTRTALEDVISKVQV
jgi:CPA2 family monovalent cation:H+ antiporter-2